VISSIDELLLKASVVLADNVRPIEDRIEKAGHLYEQADGMAQEVELEKDKYMELLDDYGEFLVTYSQLDKALSVYSREYGMAVELLGEDDARIALIHYETGGVYLEMKDYPSSIGELQKALAIQDSCLPDGHPDISGTCNRLGLAYYYSGEFTKAKEYLEKVVSSKVSGETSPRLLANVYTNLGLVYSELGDDSRELEYYRMALDIREKELGTNDTDTANSYHNMGAYHANHGDNESAVASLKKAISIYEHLLGKNHSDTATAYRSLGTVYYNMDEFENSMIYYKKALHAFKRVLGQRHPFTQSLAERIDELKGVMENN
jgi:tetratricopeptide (TPR) repeat protein